MSDLIRRSDAIEAVAKQWLFEASVESPYVNDDDIGEYRDLARELLAEIPSAKPIQTRNCDGCDIFTMAEELAMASIDACADEIVRQIKDSRVECDDCKHHHTSEMYEYCDLIAVKGRRQRVMKYCSLGERR